MHPSAECGDTHSSVTFHPAFNDRGEGVINAPGRCVRGFFCEGLSCLHVGCLSREIYLPSRAATGRADKNDAGEGANQDRLRGN